MPVFSIYHVNDDVKRKVFSIYARNLDSAFLLSQNEKNDDFKKLGVRNTTVNDIIVNEDTGKCYVIKVQDYTECSLV